MSLTVSITSLVLVSFIGSLFGLVGLVFLCHISAVNNRRIAALEQRAALEEAKRAAVENVSGLRKHYTYNTVAALTDALTVILDAQTDLDAAKSRNDTALRILASLRTDPSQSDPDRPAGKRPVDNRHGDASR